MRLIKLITPEEAGIAEGDVYQRFSPLTLMCTGPRVYDPLVLGLTVAHEDWAPVKLSEDRIHIRGNMYLFIVNDKQVVCTKAQVCSGVGLSSNVSNELLAAVLEGYSKDLILLQFFPPEPAPQPEEEFELTLQPGSIGDLLNQLKMIQQPKKMAWTLGKKGVVYGDV